MVLQWPCGVCWLVFSNSSRFRLVFFAFYTNNDQKHHSTTSQNKPLEKKVSNRKSNTYVHARKPINPPRNNASNWNYPAPTSNKLLTNPIQQTPQVPKAKTKRPKTWNIIKPKKPNEQTPTKKPKKLKKLKKPKKAKKAKKANPPLASLGFPWGPWAHGRRSLPLRQSSWCNAFARAWMGQSREAAGWGAAGKSGRRGIGLQIQSKQNKHVLRCFRCFTKLAIGHLQA